MRDYAWNFSLKRNLRGDLESEAWNFHRFRIEYMKFFTALNWIYEIFHYFRIENMKFFQGFRIGRMKFFTALEFKHNFFYGFRLLNTKFFTGLKFKAGNFWML